MCIKEERRGWLKKMAEMGLEYNVIQYNVKRNRIKKGRGHGAWPENANR